MIFQVELPDDVVAAIAKQVAEQLKPLLRREPTALTDGLLDVPGLVEYLGVSKDWVYARTTKNEIPHLKAGGLLRFRKSAIDKWLSTRTVPATELLSAPLPGNRTRDSLSRGVPATDKE